MEKTSLCLFFSVPLPNFVGSNRYATVVLCLLPTNEVFATEDFPGPPNSQEVCRLDGENKGVSPTDPHTGLGEASGRRAGGHDEMERKWDEETERLTTPTRASAEAGGEYSKERTGLCQSSRVTDSDSEKTT